MSVLIRVERQFRGFGRVDHRDSEAFGASPDVPAEHFSPPTETRTWFHQGAIGDRFDPAFSARLKGCCLLEYGGRRTWCDPLAVQSR